MDVDQPPLEDPISGQTGVPTEPWWQWFGIVYQKLQKLNLVKRVTTSPYTVLAEDDVLFVDTDAGGITVDLPPGTTSDYYRIVNVGSSGNAVTVVPNGAETLLGAGASQAVADGEALTVHYDATEGWRGTNISGLVKTFLDLTDTPASYSGEAGKTVVVNSGETALEFVNATFLRLTDTPSSYSGQAGKWARVNSGETALEFDNDLTLSVEDGITASTTQTQGERPLTENLNIVTVVASDNDVVTLPAGKAEGFQCDIIHLGANILQIFPPAGEQFEGEALNASITLVDVVHASGGWLRLMKRSATQWEYRRVLTGSATGVPNTVTGGALAFFKAASGGTQSQEMAGSQDILPGQTANAVLTPGNEMLYTFNSVTAGMRFEISCSALGEPTVLYLNQTQNSVPVILLNVGLSSLDWQWIRMSRTRLVDGDRVIEFGHGNVLGTTPHFTFTRSGKLASENINGGFYAQGVGRLGETNTEYVRTYHNGTNGIIDVNATGSGTIGTLALQTGGVTAMSITSSKKVEFIVADDTVSAFVVKENAGSLEYIAIDTGAPSPFVDIGNATDNPDLRLLGTGRLLVASGNVVRSVEAGITASTTQTQGQQPLTKDINEVDVVANANDVVTLPLAQAGWSITIRNNGANALQVFPASGDAINGGSVDASVTLAAGWSATYKAVDTVNWFGGIAAGDFIDKNKTATAQSAGFHVSNLGMAAISGNLKTLGEDATIYSGMTAVVHMDFTISAGADLTVNSGADFLARAL